MCVKLYFWNVFGYLSILVFPTSKGNRGVLVQRHQRGVQQHRVHVLRDHTVVRCLYPRLVLVHCGGEGKRRGSIQ